MSFSNRRLIVTLISCSFIIVSGQNHAQQYYKWVDAYGVTNYSSKPPINNTKKQKVETISTYGGGSNYDSVPQRKFESNASIPDVPHNYYKDNTQQYRSSTPSQRSPEQEAERQAALKAASTPYKGAQNGQLTAAQLRAQVALQGANASSGDSYSNSSYSAPMTSRQPSAITNCDSTGCWGTDGTRYNKGAGSTYFPSSGGSCQSIGGEMQCN